MMLLSDTIIDFHLFYDGAVDIQIWALLTRSQCKVSDTPVTVKANGPLISQKPCIRCRCVRTRTPRRVSTNNSTTVYTPLMPHTRAHQGRMETARLTPATPIQVNQWPSNPTQVNQWPSNPSQVNQWPRNPTEINQWPSNPTQVNQWPSNPSQVNQWPRNPTQINQS